MELAFQEVIFAVVPLKVTVLPPWVVPKLAPLMLTTAPTPPAVAERLVILGAGGGAGEKVAVILLLALKVTVQLRPEQLNTDQETVAPGLGAAVRVTGDPLANLAEHVAPQLIPAGLEVTEPVLPPKFTRLTVRVENKP